MRLIFDRAQWAAMAVTAMFPGLPESSIAPPMLLYGNHILPSANGGAARSPTNARPPHELALSL
ncbi:hypothetical protein [Ensifer adhaerens]|uniref:hypothetical protein n=1 Tax=Ensifer adhaerens TaxID=106592 RepID=UPI00098F90D5|nr:hypothetical protein [Ensifer adhaerens]